MRHEEAAVQDAMPPSPLPTLLAHPAISSAQQLLCTAACVCKEWRQAVQQCAACNTAVNLQLGNALSAEEVLLRVSSFTSWLPTHGPLVKSIELCGAWESFPDFTDQPRQLAKAVMQLLLSAMQLAYAAPATPALAAAAAASANTEACADVSAAVLRQPQPGLRLSSFSADVQDGESMLSVLPVHSLIKLVYPIFGFGTRPAHGAVLAQGLARLHNLEQLQISAYVPISSLTVLGQLTRLTHLHLSTIPQDTPQTDSEAMQQVVEQLPQQLQQIHIEHFSMQAPTAPINMRHLTHLQDLRLFGYQPGQLPRQLQHLIMGLIDSGRPLAAITSLQQLTHLSFEVSVNFQEHAVLLQLAGLKALQHLGLTYGKADTAQAAAATWVRLPQLRRLIVGGGASSRQQMAAILAGVAAAASLTEMHLNISVQRNAGDQQVGGGGAEAEAADAQPYAPCWSLASLSALESLSLLWPRYADEGFLQVAPGDALSLTTFTRLTHLELFDLGDSVGDLTAAALACNLRQLQHLYLRKCSLGSMVCLASIAHLSQLSRLQLVGDDVKRGLTTRGLMLLTTLTSLQCLNVERNNEVTHEALDEFWAAQRLGVGRNAAV